MEALTTPQSPKWAVLLWRDFCGALVNLRHYACLLKRRPGQTALYFVFLLLLLTFAEMAVFAVNFFPRFNALTTALARDISGAYIKDGVLTVNVPQPYMLTVEGIGTLIVDTTGKNTSPKEGEILVTGREVLTVGAHGLIRHDLLAKLGDLEINAAQIDKWSRTVLMGLVPFSAVMGFMAHTVRKAIHVFWLALLGLIMAKLFKAPLRFRQALMLAVYCLSAPVVMAALLIFSGIYFAGFSWPYFGSSVIYMGCAIYYLSKNGDECCESCA